MTNIALHRIAWCTAGLLLALFFGCTGRVEGPPADGGGDGGGGDGGSGGGGSTLPPSPCGSYLTPGDCCNDPQKYKAGCIWLDPMPEFVGGCVSKRDCTFGDGGCPEGQVCTLMTIAAWGECNILADVEAEQGVCIDE